MSLTYPQDWHGSAVFLSFNLSLSLSHHDLWHETTESNKNVTLGCRGMLLYSNAVYLVSNNFNIDPGFHPKRSCHERLVSCWGWLDLGNTTSTTLCLASMHPSFCSAYLVVCAYQYMPAHIQTSNCDPTNIIIPLFYFCAIPPVMYLYIINL